MSEPVIRSTNLAVPKPVPGRGKRPTGIDKRPVAALEVFEPGPSYGDGPGVRGDLVGDSRHHGGAQKAVYAYAREELDHWGRELGRTFTDGFFGENLTTEGIDLEALRLGQRLVLGEVVLEVSIPRSPCVTFAAHVGVRGWLKRFTARGRCGAYLRVVTPGTIRPGTPVVLDGTPPHDVDMRTAFTAAMGDDEAAARVVAARCLPPLYHDRLVERLATSA